MTRRPKRSLWGRIVGAVLLCCLVSVIGACTRSNNIPAETPPEIRFFAIGDQGTGGASQQAVADAIAAKCAADGCDFGITLGDNFYPEGVTSTNDLLWNTVFVQPYATIDVPFYASLGNHDYAVDKARGQVQVDYGLINSKWIMPAQYYAFDAGNATFLAISSHLIQSNYSTSVVDQGAYFANEIAQSEQPWKIMFGHHPYISDGGHGNAGNYDDVPDRAIALKEFFETYICGTIDIYLSGHDHNLQTLQGPQGPWVCPNYFIVSGGGGAGLYNLPGRDENTTEFSAKSFGFAYMHLTSTTFTLELVNENGDVLFTKEIQAQP